ncbi:hypothetical protein [Niabella aurantiaca]|uniref:hypothetical protein n=1 Tax=Niabella aurantiaca TaxID=379900 RepID=UPI00035D5C2C|nr:hypothetical protein [Niabella aurantiaca]
MKIVIAPGAFKSRLPTARVQEGRAVVFAGELACCRVGDGSDGTGSLLRQYLDVMALPAAMDDPPGSNHDRRSSAGAGKRPASGKYHRLIIGGRPDRRI